MIPGLGQRAIAAAAAAIEASPLEVVGARRHGHFARARWAVMRALSSQGWSTPRIGRALGGRDHTTVMYGVGRAAELYGEDPDFAALCDRVSAYMKPPAKSNAVPTAAFVSGGQVYGFFPVAA